MMGKKSRYSGIVCACLIGIAAAPAWSAALSLVDARLPSYQPKPVTVDKSRGYVQPDGSIQIVGFDDMGSMLAGFNKLFVQSHPGLRFKMEMKGNGPAIPALTYDASAFAPVGGGATLLQLLPYEKIHGSKAEPVAALAIRVAHSSLNPKAKLGPLGVVVHKDNPIKSLTMEQVTGMFAYGSGTGDVTSWSQLGVAGPLKGQSIHPTGLSEDAYDRPEDLGMGEYMMYRKMGAFPGFPFSPRYERMKRYADVVDRVAGDPLAVGLVALNKVGAKVRVVPLVGNDGKTLTSGSAADIVAGNYPYDRYLYIYVRRPVGEPFDPFVKEYLRMMLSKQGQTLIAKDAKGYLPLSFTEVEEELAKLERAEVWQPRNKQGPELNYPFPSPQP
jgi:phosphate transport system substrate-binding protein